MNAIITVDNLSKSYTIGHLATKGDGLRHAIENALRAPFRSRAARQARKKQTEEEFWALRNVDLEIEQGETVGIIGRNGAGKSTLLKILSRITDPTQGRVRLRGRVASLLEVGTGFHPELTGRENIFLNGAILGMRRAEIKRKFDEIVAFSEIEKFIDTPVKRYSSGMYVRLAFAVAAHLEPEILIVDEVLAVGDSAFQKKCLGKMENVARQGRTVLFVSHNLGVVSKLCPRAVLLFDGHKKFDGPASQAISRYLATSFQAEGERSWPNGDGPGNQNVRLRCVRVISGDAPAGEVNIDQPLEIQIDYETLREGMEISTSIHLLDAMGGEILSSINLPSASLEPDPLAFARLPKGLFRASCTIPANFLNESTYGVNIALLNRSYHAEVFEREAIRFRAHDAGGMRGEYTGTWIGVVRPKLAWQTQILS